MTHGGQAHHGSGRGTHPPRSLGVGRGGYRGRNWYRLHHHGCPPGPPPPPRPRRTPGPPAAPSPLSVAPVQMKGMTPMRRPPDRFLYGSRPVLTTPRNSTGSCSFRQSADRRFATPMVTTTGTRTRSWTSRTDPPLSVRDGALSRRQVSRPKRRRSSSRRRFGCLAVASLARVHPRMPPHHLLMTLVPRRLPFAGR